MTWFDHVVSITFKVLAFLGLTIAFANNFYEVIGIITFLVMFSIDVRTVRP